VVALQGDGSVVETIDVWCRQGCRYVRDRNGSATSGTTGTASPDPGATCAGSGPDDAAVLQSLEGRGIRPSDVLPTSRRSWMRAVHRTDWEWELVSCAEK